MSLKLEGFKYATSPDLNMGYYHIKLCFLSRKLYTKVPPWGKYEYQNPYIFHEKMNKLFHGLDYIRTYIDDLLIINNKSFEDWMIKLDKVLNKQISICFKWNAEKFLFARNELVFLGFRISREGITPLPDKEEAIKK